MENVIVGFAGGITKLDQGIELASGGLQDNISHAFMILFNSTLESTGNKEASDKYPGVWLHKREKFIGDPYAKFIQVAVQDIAAGEELARNLLGTFYGYTDCFRGGAYEIFGIEIPDNTRSMDCSELITRVLRAMGLNVLPDLEAGCVAPEKLYKSLMDDFNGLDITADYR